MRRSAGGRGWARIIPQRRQIILRSDERISQITLGRPAQLLLLMVLLGAIGWSVFVSDRFVRNEAVVTSLQTDHGRELARAKREHTAALAAVGQDHRGRLARKDAEIAAVIAAMASDRDREVAAKTAEIATVKQSTEAARLALRSQLAQSEQRVDALAQSLQAAQAEGTRLMLANRDLTAGGIDLRRRLGSATFDRNRLLRQDEAKQAQVAGLTGRVDALSTANDSLAHSLATTRRALVLASDERRDAVAARVATAKTLNDTRRSLDQLAAERDTLVADLEQARGRIAALDEGAAVVASARDSLIVARSRLEAQVADLTGVAHATRLERDDLASRLRDVTDELHDTVGRHSGLMATREQLTARIGRLEENLAVTSRGRDAQSVALRASVRHARALDAGISQANAERQRLVARIGDLEADYDVLAGGRRADYAALRSLAATARGVTAERDRLASDKADLEAIVASLTADVTHLRGSRNVQNNSLARLSAQLESVENERSQLLTARDALATQVTDLSAQIDTLKRSNNDRQTTLQATTSDLRLVDSERQQLVVERDQLKWEMASLEDQVAAARRDGLARQDDLLATGAQLMVTEAQLSDLISERGRFETERLRLEDNVVTLEARIDDLALDRETLTTTLRTTEETLDGVLVDREEISGERDELAERADELAQRLGDLEEARVDVLAQLEQSTTSGIEMIERTLVSAGLDLDRVLDRIGARPEARGGPFVPFPRQNEPGADLAVTIADLDARLAHWRGLMGVMERLPLAFPLDDGFEITDTFGRRTDPFTGRPAIHEGIDFGSRARRPVYSTAPGRVSFVGWKGGFGKMVEIDHGLGLRTRYAHLRTIFVKRGQDVDFRERIGEVGSTGRSSGPHLHYEVLVDGRPRNPENFLRAGQYVFKG